MKPEARLQKTVCQYLDWMLPANATYWATLNERKTPAHIGAMFNGMGRKAGVADLIILHAGRFIAIELKVKPNTQSKTQKAWQGVVERCGGFYALCFSLEDVRGSLRAFGVPVKDKADA